MDGVVVVVVGWFDVDWWVGVGVCVVVCAVVCMVEWGGWSSYG